MADNMNKVASVRQEVVALMGGCIQELRSERYPRSLRERVAEDQSREVHIRETIEREREASTAVRDLRQQLMQERESHEEGIISQGQILAELKELVKELSAATVIETAYTAKEVQAKNACAKRTEGEELARLGAEAEALRVRLRRRLDTIRSDDVDTGRGHRSDADPEVITDEHLIAMGIMKDPHGGWVYPWRPDSVAVGRPGGRQQRRASPPQQRHLVPVGNDLGHAECVAQKGQSPVHQGLGVRSGHEDRGGDGEGSTVEVALAQDVRDGLPGPAALHPVPDDLQLLGSQRSVQVQIELDALHAEAVGEPGEAAPRDAVQMSADSLWAP